MIKESILLVAATSLLVYIVMPAEEPVAAEAAPQEMPTPVVEEPVAISPKPPEHAWGYDESGNDGQSFVFGEPVTAFESGDTSKPSETETASNSYSSENGTSASSNGSQGGSPPARILD